MALFAGRFRRALTLSYSLINHQRLSSSICPTIPTSSFALCPENPSLEFGLSKIPFQSRNFKSSPVSFQAARSTFRGGDNEEITEDTILFEGCDYNHWLITMDFPKDPEPTREEKIETYLQTLAKVVGSYEEAKKKMYALSTTTYQGFQCVVTEEMSEKFKGLPGVVFVLPDSYIDPVNKEYGGDKYENGLITPRPPPFQYGRNRGRSGGQNRDYNRRDGSESGNSGFVNQERNFRQPGDYSRPQPSGGMRDNSQSSNIPGRRDSIPPFQSNYGQGGVGYSNFQGGSPSGYGPPQGENFGPPRGANYRPQAGGAYGQAEDTNYRPSRGSIYGQQAGGNYGQQAGGNYGQQAGGNYGQQAGSSYGSPEGGNIGHREAGSYGQGAGRNYGQTAGGNFGQQGSEYYGQPNAQQNYGQPGIGNHSQRPGGNYGQGFSTGQGQQAGSASTGFVQDFQTQGEEHKFRQMEQQGNMQGDQRNTSTPQNVVDQVKY